MYIWRRERNNFCTQASFFLKSRIRISLFFNLCLLQRDIVRKSVLHAGRRTMTGRTFDNSYDIFFESCRIFTQLPY